MIQASITVWQPAQPETRPHILWRRKLRADSWHTEKICTIFAVAQYQRLRTSCIVYWCCSAGCVLHLPLIVWCNTTDWSVVHSTLLYSLNLLFGADTMSALAAAKVLQAAQVLEQQKQRKKAEAETENSLQEEVRVRYVI